MYPGQDAYARLVDHAFAAWDRLWERLGRKHLAETGVLAVSNDPGDWTDQRPRRARPARHSLSRDGTWPSSAGACRSSSSPTAPPASSPSAAAPLPRPHRHRPCRGAARRAASPWCRARRSSIDRGSRPGRTESGAVFLGDRVVFSGGAWASHLFPDFAAALVTYRQAVLYVAAPAKWAAAWAETPVIVDLGGESGCYVLPPVDGSDLKIARPTIAAAAIRSCTRRSTRTRTRRSAPISATPCPTSPITAALYMKTCFYTIAPDDRFQLQRRERLILFSGCSGHGYKFAALNGEKLAQVVLGEADLEATAKLLGGYD